MANIALHACFVDLEKAFDRVSRDKLWKVLCVLKVVAAAVSN